MLEVDLSLLEQRRRLGLDRRDEMWEGVLHMVPAPYDEHQRTVEDLLVFLKPLLRQRRRGTLRMELNVFDEASPVENYRIPDLIFVAAGRERLFAKDGIRGGGPDAVFEIRSPNDESYEKLPFYAKVGVREVIIIDRDRKTVELFSLTAAGAYEKRAAESDGAIPSTVLALRFRTMPGDRPVLVVADAEDPGVRVEI
jgi:Uma2 family endonuclease